MGAKKFIVMMQNYWGRGDSPIEAANVARKQGGKKPAKRLPKPCLVFSYDPAETPQAYVNEMGYLCWEGKRPAEVERVGM